MFKNTIVQKHNSELEVITQGHTLRAIRESTPTEGHAGSSLEHEQEDVIENIEEPVTSALNFLGFLLKVLIKE